MKRSKFAAAMQDIAVCTGLLTFIITVLYLWLGYPFLLTLAITFGTTFYHFAIRLIVGALVPNCFDYHAKWFRPLWFEDTLYRKLRLKRWKKQMPTYDPRRFCMQHNTPQQIIGNMCQAEVVHEIIILFSFVPLLFSLLWDTFAAFLITSVLAAAVDLIFVMMQRYNRPRFVRILETKKERSSL